MKLQTIVAALALAATGAANASLNDFTTGNSSLAFIAYDSVATGANTAVGSVFVDLGLNLNDFDPRVAGNLAGANNKVVWNFNTNTITKNGTLVNATNDFSSFAAFISANGVDAKWGVIAADSISVPQRVLTTGTPTATQLNQQNSSATAGSLAVQSLYVTTNGLLNSSVDNASYFANNAADVAYIPVGTNFGPNGNWVNKQKWAAVTANNQTNFTLNDGDGSELVVGASEAGWDTTGLLNDKGTWTLDKAAGTLTWQTAVAVPEPSTYVLALVGLAAMGAVARRRAAK